jgi:hypothetical protein
MPARFFTNLYGGRQFAEDGARSRIRGAQTSNTCLTRSARATIGKSPRRCGAMRSSVDSSGRRVALQQKQEPREPRHSIGR